MGGTLALPIKSNRHIPPKAVKALWGLLISTWLLCVPAKSLQLCLTLCETVDCSLPGASVHRILQAGILEWTAISYSRGWDRTLVY